MSFNELRKLLFVVFESRIIIRQFKTSELLHHCNCIQHELLKRGLKPYYALKIKKHFEDSCLMEGEAIEERSDEGNEVEPVGN